MPEARDDQPGFISFVNWGFQALLLALVTWGVSELSSLSKSVHDLNVKMAVVLERDQARGDEVKSLKIRMDRLDRRE